MVCSAWGSKVMGSGDTATRLPRRRAWPRIFVVRCNLPCDPPVGSHSCNGGMIPRFHRAVSLCDRPGQAGRLVHFRSNAKLPLPTLRECGHRSLARRLEPDGQRLHGVCEPAGGAWLNISGASGMYVALTRVVV